MDMMTTELLKDPIEDDPRYSEAFKAADLKAQKELEMRERENLHILLAQTFEADLIKQRILKKEYGIRWRITSEMNPGTCFD
jgi:hypothetical protein